MAAILHGRNNKNVCIRMNILSHRSNILLFVPCNMVAIQNLYCTEIKPKRGYNSMDSKQSGAILEYRATYLHISERFLERSILKQKELFKFNEMQISGPVFYSLANSLFTIHDDREHMAI